jgi:trehalose 6-phosphate phosphatase
MRHVFSPAGDAALVAVVSRRPLLAFDFDGTLAPIVPRPGDARLSAAIVDRLRVLSRRLPVAIITGRSRDDVLQRLHFEPHYVVGNHGAENPLDVSGGVAHIDALATMRAVISAEREVLDAAGVMVEDKGQSLALHYRLSGNRNRARAAIDTLLQSVAAPIRIFPGKMVVNVAPADAPDKAHAIHRLLAHCGADCALFAGDDVNDEPVFESARPGWLTIRVGRDYPASRAQFVLDGPHEMALLLDRITALLGPERTHAGADAPAL